MKITAAAVLLGVSRLVLADDVTVTATPQAPPWTANNACGLSVSTIFQNIGLFVVPLTPQAGANSSTGVACLGFNVSGTLMAVDNTNFDKVKGQDTTAFIACDSPVVATVTTPSGIIGSLMTVQPPLRAIILYPQGADNWCDMQSNSGAAFSYNSIYTMNNSQKAGLVLQALGDPNHQPVLSSITAINSTATDNKNQPNAGATSPAAMSALYAVTGIITLLFLIIIVTGTIRAHRNPERYGPRAAFGGRMAQSRAKGLARAVLDTIPIVKFNDSREPKPETAIELGNGAQSGTTPAVGVDAVQHTGVNHTEEAASPNGLKEDSKPTTSITAAAGEAHEESVGTVVSNSPNEDNPADFDPDNLGCSICTEDFTAGEDVRVLPCQHQFHPSCIDPWLTNVSGTCPLCRLDLRPEEQRLAEENGENGESLPPPLTEDGQAISFRTLRPMTMLGRSQPVLRRQEVMLASIRARQASIDAAAAAAAAAEGDGEGGTSRTGLSARLRERFHIRTRTQPAQEPNT